MPPWMGTDPSLSSRVIGAWSSTVGNRISCVGSGSGPCSAAGAQVQRTRLQPAAEIFQACAVSSTFPFPQHQNLLPRHTLFPPTSSPPPIGLRFATRRKLRIQDLLRPPCFSRGAPFSWSRSAHDLPLAIPIPGRAISPPRAIRSPPTGHHRTTVPRRPVLATTQVKARGWTIERSIRGKLPSRSSCRGRAVTT